MKALKTKPNFFKAANVSFDAESIEARSYQWWIFVKKIKGRVIFNEYRYSVTTSKHQSKVKSLLNDLGIKIDEFVKTRKSLSDFNTLSDIRRENLHTLKVLAQAAELKHIERKAKAKARRDAAKALKLAEKGN